MREKIDFTDDTVIVTGGSSGIGKATAEEFAKEGAAVVIADIDTDSGDLVVDEIESAYGTPARFEYTDVSDYESCVETSDVTVEEFGSVDVLVNTAAARGPGHTMDDFVEESPEDWEIEFEVTMKGAMNMAHAVLDPMIEQGDGVILSTSSDSYQGQDPGLAVYAAAKAAIVAFTRTLAKEVGEHGIRANVVSPATTRTPATEDILEKHEGHILKSYPLGRIGEPEDHANAFVFLASDAADWVSGQTLSVNGGYL